MSMTGIPAGAGTFRIVREKRMVRGKMTRVSALVFTTHDGFVGESRPRGGKFCHREAYEAAVAARAAALYRVQATQPTQAAAVPSNPKPAPAAQLLTAIKDTLLFSEVERRGYEVAIAT